MLGRMTLALMTSKRRGEGRREADRELSADMSALGRRFIREKPFPVRRGRKKGSLGRIPPPLDFFATQLYQTCNSHT